MHRLHRGLGAPAWALIAAITLIAATALAALHPTSAVAAPAPILGRGSAGVTADALPTVQIDGVVWTQVVIGSTVYAGGQFSYARPAGAAPGQSQSRRWNLLAYDINSGKLIPGFAPQLNGAVRSLAKSSDGKSLFVGGDFTVANGKQRLRFAALAATSGGLLSPAPAFNSTVRTLATTSTTVFVGGSFTKVGTASRSKLAAVAAGTGKLLSWAPKADNYVRAMTLTPDRKRVIVGGAFGTVNGAINRGMAAVDAVTGSLRGWEINKTIQDYGAHSAITSLTADATTVYGSGYAYGGGNYEGAFAADPNTGKIRWLQDCRGDTYSVAVASGRVYSVGHAHDCSNLGGFPESSPLAYRALAVSSTAGGTLAKHPKAGYAKFAGRPAPALVNWFPSLTSGTFTGQGQAAWSVASAGPWVVLGGEFTAVNGTKQQGLVRFISGYRAPRKQGPLSGGTTSAPTVQISGNTAQVSWNANHDRDDQQLSYQVLRDGQVVATTSRISQFWNRPTLSATDTGLVAGRRYKYEIVASDADGNSLRSASVSVTTPAEQPAAADPAADPAAAAAPAAEQPADPAQDQPQEQAPAETHEPAPDQARQAAPQPDHAQHEAPEETETSPVREVETQ